MDSSTHHQLLQSFINADVYNRLPHADIKSASDLEISQSSARKRLLRVISDHGLDDILSLHLLHRHYDLAPNHAMVYERPSDFRDPQAPFIEICRPINVDQLPATHRLRGKFFFYCSETNSLRAYEFTSEDVPDIEPEKCSMFIEDFISQLVSLGMENTLALAVASPQETRRVLLEIEVPDHKSTLRIEKDSWVPGGFNTDWFSTSQNLDGVNTCLDTTRQLGSGSGHAVSRFQHTSIHFIEPPMDSAPLGILFNDEELDRDSTAYGVILQASKLIISQ